MPDTDSSSTLPLLRWAGSKRASVKKLAHYWSGAKTYIEPFCGSAALFFYLAPNQSVLTDINPRLINFYKQCQTNPWDIWDISSRLSLDEETYYDVREKYNKEADLLLQASYFLYLNRTCFNGIYRTNRKGEFNVPYSGKRVSNFFALEDFLTRCKALGSVEFYCLDFQSTIEEHADDNSFFFIDPPYAKSTGRAFTEYDSKSFGVRDFDRLLSSLKSIDDTGGDFVMTYDAASPPFDYEANGWSSAKFEVTRNVGGFRASRRVATEIAVTNIDRYR